MKKSKDWLTQGRVDEAADEYLAAKGGDIAGISVYDFAKHFDFHANSSLYAKVTDWRERRLAEASDTPFDAPPEAVSAFKMTLDQAGAAMMADYVKSLRDIHADIKRPFDAALSSGERQKKNMQAEIAELIRLCGDLEDRLTEAGIRIVDLGRELEAGRDRENQLLGRIEQCQIDVRNAQAVSRGHAPKRKEKAAAPKVQDASAALFDDAPLLAAINETPSEGSGNLSPRRADPEGV